MKKTLGLGSPSRSSNMKHSSSPKKSTKVTFQKLEVTQTNNSDSDVSEKKDIDDALLAPKSLIDAGCPADGLQGFKEFLMGAENVRK